MRHVTKSFRNFNNSIAEISAFNAYVHGVSVELDDKNIKNIAFKHGSTYSPYENENFDISNIDQSLLLDIAENATILHKFEDVKPILNQMTFSRCIDNLLSYISELLFEIYTVQPNLLKSNETMKISSILDYDSKNQIINYLAEKKVKDLAYKGFEEMNQILEKTMGFKLVDDLRTIKKVSLAIQKRNLIVHNRGIVTKFALKKYPELGYNIGEFLKIADMDAFEIYNFTKTIVDAIDKKAVHKFKIASFEYRKKKNA